MGDFTFWPANLLPARDLDVNPVPFTRSGGRTLGGKERGYRTDKGFWSLRYGFQLSSRAQRRAWNAIRTEVSGRSGLVVMPVWTWDTAPYASGEFESDILTTHSDGSTFADGGLYRQGSILIRTAESAQIGETSVRLEVVQAEADLFGVRFSYRHALYETGFGSREGSIWTVNIFPAIRAPIPAGRLLEFNLPSCLSRLSEDRGLDVAMNPAGITEHSVGFEEATEYWSDLAAGLI